MIAFERSEGAASHIYSINEDGTDEQQLTHGADSDHSPAWSQAPPKAAQQSIGYVANSGYHLARGRIRHSPAGYMMVFSAVWRP
jgi:hypothetical protein